MSRTVTSVTDKDCVSLTTTRAFYTPLLRFCEANMTLLMWMTRVLLEWRKLAYDFTDGMEGLPRHSHHWRGTKGYGEQSSLYNKAPGRDGICLEFFKVNWDSMKDDMLALFKQMYLDGRIMQ